MKLIPGVYYKVLHYAWASPSGIPINEEDLGFFVRFCPEIPDWNNAALEFMKDGVAIHIRLRRIHKLVDITDAYFIKKAEERMNKRIGGRTLKEEIVMFYRPIRFPSH